MATARTGPRSSATTRRASSCRKPPPGRETRASPPPGIAQGRPARCPSLLQQPQLSFRRNQRHHLQQRPRLRVERRRPGQHRIAQARRDLAGRPGQQLGHEERVALGRREHLVPVTADPLGERATAAGDRRSRRTRPTPGAEANRPSIARNGCSARCHRLGRWREPVPAPVRPAWPCTRARRRSRRRPSEDPPGRSPPAVGFQIGQQRPCDLVGTSSLRDELRRWRPGAQS